MPGFLPRPSALARREAHYEGWLQLRTPLLHGGDEATGNVRLFNSQKTVCPDGVVRRLPFYSGNAYRGMLRDIAARQLLDALNVLVPPPVFHFLTSGGSLTGGGGATVIDVGLARRLRDTVPMVALFGGGVGSQILEGKTTFLQGTVICSETVDLLPAFYRRAPSAGLSYRELRCMSFGTRRDDAKREGMREMLSGPEAARKPDDVATSMIYENEGLAPGSCLRFGFVARDVSEAEWACLCMALVGMMRHPFLGGRGAAGFGEINAPLLCRAGRQVAFHGGAGGIVDLARPLATVEDEIEVEEQLAVAAEVVQGQYLADVTARRAEIIEALGRVG